MLCVLDAVDGLIASVSAGVCGDQADADPEPGGEGVARADGRAAIMLFVWFLPSLARLPSE